MEGLALLGGITEIVPPIVVEWAASFGGTILTHDEEGTGRSPQTGLEEILFDTRIQIHYSSLCLLFPSNQ